MGFVYDGCEDDLIRVAEYSADMMAIDSGLAGNGNRGANSVRLTHQIDHSSAHKRQETTETGDCSADEQAPGHAHRGGISN